MEEPDFPRGRPAATETKNAAAATKKDYNKRKHRDAETRIASDFLFGGDKKRDSVKKKPKKEDKKDDSVTVSSKKKSLLPMGGGGVVFPSSSSSSSITNKPSYIEGLSFGKLVKGMRLLGCVKEIHQNVIVFSLPNLWTGYMMVKNDDLAAPSMVSIGQYLSIVIVKAVQEATKEGPKRRIQVSCLPSVVNPSGGDFASACSSLRGQVLSAEDHGLLIDLGLGRKGFLNFSDIEEEYTTAAMDATDSLAVNHATRILAPGRIDDFLPSPTASKDTKILKLVLPSRMTTSQALLSKVPSLNALQPGSLVQVSVEAFTRNGICVTFGKGVFRGAIEVSHLGCAATDEWKLIFQTHKHFCARIICVDASSKIVRLSILPHLLQLTWPELSSRLIVGSIVEDATVVRVDPGVGAVLALPADEIDVDMDIDATNLNAELLADDRYKRASHVPTVYVHISKAFDSIQGNKTPEAVFAKEFAPNTKHRVRILNIMNLIDDVASGATASSIVDAHVLTHDDLKAGQVYRQVPVCSHINGNGSNGVLVDFGMGIRGLIPPLHLLDHTVTPEYRGKMVKELYAIGAKVDVRVLSVDPATKRCLLTAKKALIKSKHVITSFDSVKVGQKAVGFVTKVDPRGLSVTFFNGVYGRVTARSILAELGIENVEENYSVGDAVNCCVVNAKKRGDNRGDRRRSRDGAEADQQGDGSSSYWELTLILKPRSVMDQDDLSLMNVDDEKTNVPVPLQLGTILPLRSMRIIELKKGTEKVNGFVSGYAIVSVKSKYLIEAAESWRLPDFVECKLPFDQLLDEYDEAAVVSASALDALAEKLLTIGKKIGRRGIVLTDPRKTGAEYSAATGAFTVISIRPKLVEYFVAKSTSDGEAQEILIPTADSHLYVGAKLLGYVAQVDARHGAFVRFLDGLTGLVPKMKGGLELPKLKTVVTQVAAIDATSRPPRISLSLVGDSVSSPSKKTTPTFVGLDVGDDVGEAEILQVDFHRASLNILGTQGGELGNVRVRLHHSLASSEPLSKPVDQTNSDERRQLLSKYHPFFGLVAGSILRNLQVAAIDSRKGQVFVELSRQSNGAVMSPSFFENPTDVVVGKKVTGVISSVDVAKGGLYLQLSPGVSAFLPALELSEDIGVLNNLRMHFPVGARLECLVIDKSAWLQARSTNHASQTSKDVPYLSFLKRNDMKSQIAKPSKGDIVIGRVHRKVPTNDPPALSLELRGGFVARCCVTELKEADDWKNMPIANVPLDYSQFTPTNDESFNDADSDDDDNDIKIGDQSARDPWKDGSFVVCRVLFASSQVIDVSLRPSRLDGDLEDDETPQVDQLVNAYVVDTNKKGCFVRLSRQVEGRVILKEMCDGYLADPRLSFPAGRLVVGKVKAIRKSKNRGQCKWLVDLDMRESVVLAEDKLRFDQVEIGKKFKAVVTRVEDYGVFVRIDNSECSGLVHKSECSDDFVKNLAELYDPGDLVKVLVIKKDPLKNQLGFSMKQSHFEGDDDSSSDDESTTLLDAGDVDQAGMTEVMDAGDSDDDLQSSAVNDLSSDDEADSSDESENADKGEISASEPENETDAACMDTNVGFNWSEAPALNDTKSTQALDSDDEDEESINDDDDTRKQSHKSRRKHAQRLREEQDIARREFALADGTADEKPETAGDFERLLAGSPNSSELWIMYMAFHMSLADIPAARKVAERAFQKIEFRQEREKMNVWTALITLELRYGTDKSFQETIDRASKHNNPKYVYLRISEILEKDTYGTAGESVKRCDDMYNKMTKKFRDKKKVWLAHIAYLLKTNRADEAQALSKRAMQSLPTHKHIETMSRFAQLVFEFGKPEHARTIFDGLLLKYPKRLDLLFVYVDKELKHGDVKHARELLERQVRDSPAEGKLKLNDKQMKKLFKKWYSVEEQHGDEPSQERVKDAARAYVQQAIN
ncbi:hypothetical protein MPSEU_000007600 [Mayamaea pseudoterrestris]|nr:hypothetical protein MPSEU_000007600 [Mayamaea pseudoterrestris]